jgi:hypothetical protein
LIQSPASPFCRQQAACGFFETQRCYNQMSGMQKFSR